MFLPKGKFHWRIPLRLRRRRTRPLLAVELGQIARLNSQLADIEVWIEAEADAMRQAFLARKAAGDPHLADFELEAEVTLYLRNDDPKWLDNDDNQLMKLTVCLTKPDAGRHWALRVPGEVRQALGSARVTELLYTLFEYGGFSPFDLSRVGQVWAEVVATAQKCVQVQEVRNAG